MANPVRTACPEDVWTLAIEDETEGNIFLQVPAAEPGQVTPVFIARRDHGQAAPTDGKPEDGWLIPDTQISCKNSAASDWYIMPTQRDIYVIVDV